MSRALAVALTGALVGAAGTLGVGALVGMDVGEVTHLLALMLPAVAVTVVVVVAARVILVHATFRQRLVAIALTASLASLANLAVLASLMFVSAHDAVLMGALAVYAAGAGIGAALALSRRQAAAIERLVGTAEAIAEGDLTARAGVAGAGPELDALARALDEMASRLEGSIRRERGIEQQRRDLMIAVSHDLRTPLAGLRAMVEAVDDRVVEDLPTLRRYAGEMRRQIDTLVSLVDDLFELARIDAGAIEAEAERARLDEIVRSAVVACRMQAAEKGLRVQQRLDGAGTALCSPRLIRVLQNLLQNAIRHTPPDGTVRIEAHRRPDGLEVVVADEGEGIEPQALGRVFDPFWRGDTARSTPGSGLGLALSQRIVQALGGDIRVDNQRTQGARFAVLLPDIA